MLDTVIALSGGMDSAVLLYDCLANGQTVRAISVDYGQRHRRELDAAKELVVMAGADFDQSIPWDVVDLTSVTKLLIGSSLTDPSVPVPHGHYAEETMRQTVVPNRNMIMLSVAAAVAVAHNARYVATAVHAGDHYIYPDCRPDFIKTLEQAIQLGNQGHGRPVSILTPFITLTKGDIVRHGLDLDVPFGSTWTCYEGGSVACGRCGSCNERLEAFAEAGALDPIPYATGS